MTLPQLASFADFAAMIGVSPPYVAKLKKQNRLVIVKDEAGRERVDVEQSKKLISATTDMGRADNGQNAKAGAGSTVAREAGQGGKLDITYKEARTHEAAFRAKLTELEYREKEGALVEAEKVRRVVVGFAAEARLSFEKVADKLAQRLAAEQDVTACHTLLATEIDEVLSGMAKRVQELKLGGSDGSA